MPSKLPTSADPFGHQGVVTSIGCFAQVVVLLCILLNVLSLAFFLLR
jgi:hypothetical protein